MFFKLFTSCKITLGISNSLISDVQRGVFINVPNSLISVIHDLETKSITELNHDFSEEDKLTFNEYISFLINNEFGFVTETPELFVYSKYDELVEPSSNTILEFSLFTDINFKIISQLNTIKTEALQLNIYSKVELEQFKKLLSHIMHTTSIRFVSLLCSYNENIKEQNLVDLGFKYPILGQISIYDSPFNKECINNFIKINYRKEEKISKKNCGIVNSNYFSCNSQLHDESNKFNTCLAGKISIDIDGNIKNCPSMSQSFGNIKNTTFEEALNHKDFKKYWTLTKNDIQVCQDCEFRFICIDCRAYTELTHENEEGLDVSKPLKCGYSPYTGEWQEWSANPLKEKAIKYYQM